MPANKIMKFFTKISVFFIGIFLLLATENLYAVTDSLKELRSLYKDAQESLDSKKYTVYQQQREELGEYPLVAYLDYKEIIKKGNSPTKLENFINEYPNFPHTRAFRSRLLGYYYEQKDWDGIMEYSNGNRDLCLQLAAGHYLKQDRDSLRSKAEKLWLSGKNLDDRCITILKRSNFDFFKNSDMVWRRVVAAAKARNWVLVRNLRSHIKTNHVAAYDALQKLRFGKRRVVAYTQKLKNNQASRDVLVYALSRYPSDHADEAYRIYKNIVKPKFSFNEKDRNTIEYYLGLHLTINDERQGFDVMEKLNPVFLEDEEHEWRARSAIKFAQWKKLINFIEHFPPELAADATWLYWKGYALTKTGARGEAKGFYQRASNDRSFYGFLAAEQVGAPKSINHRPARSTKGSSILDVASFKRFYELHALGARGALSEWETTLQKASREQLLYLASASYSRDWLYHSIRAFAVAQYWDDLHRRFPLPYREEIEKAAKQNRMRPSLIYGVMRTESTFRPQVVSAAGAVGLMQVLPSTGRSVIRRIKYSGSKRLTNPQTSINVGSYYLKTLLNQYKGNAVLAIASYNAGPYAVKDWLPKHGTKPAVEWLETIPYGETRKYVRTILYSQIIFEWRLGEKENSLSLNRLMQSIHGKY